MARYGADGNLDPTGLVHWLVDVRGGRMARARWRVRRLHFAARGGITDLGMGLLAPLEPSERLLAAFVDPVVYAASCCF